MTIKSFVINLDRRPDRLTYMADQLDRLGMPWERISALDKDTASDAEIAQEVKLSGHRIRMGRGSQCCAITNFRIFRHMIEADLPAALILQDDVELAPEITDFVADLSWLPKGVGLVQFEKFGRKSSRRLATKLATVMPCPDRALYKLHSRTAGAGCFLITQDAARIILEQKPLLDMPIDHFLFSPNVSPLFDQLGVAIVAPALARQKMEEIASDISAERARSKSLTGRMKRFYWEVNRLPGQLLHYVKGARSVEFGFDAGNKTLAKTGGSSGGHDL